MDCDKKQFLSLLDPWRGKRCVVMVVSELMNCRLGLRLKSLSIDGVITFGEESTEQLKLDLSSADHFEFGDSRMADDSLAPLAELVFDSVVCARITGTLLVGICLLREQEG
jgi:hypothetical protein